MPEAHFDLEGRRVWVAGHNGLVGSAVVRRLASEGCKILTADRAELDLRDPRATRDWMSAKGPHAVVLAAARVGGILANDSRPAEFIADNLAIQQSVIDGGRHAGVEKLLFLGSSCIYPRLAAQPIREDAFLTGPLEETNRWYAIAKIAGIAMCQAIRRQYGLDFISAMPTNLYGPGDNFDLASSHVVAALIRKAHETRANGGTSLQVWGTGRVRREFLFVDDCADALVYLLKHYSDEVPINVGTGADVTVTELARLVAKVVGFNGTLVFDPTKPDGTPRKQLDVTRLNALGWHATTSLEEGLRRTYEWYRRNPDRRAAAGGPARRSAASTFADANG